jgi:hypothetical protein
MATQLGTGVIGDEKRLGIDGIGRLPPRPKKSGSGRLRRELPNDYYKRP